MIYTWYLIPSSKSTLIHKKNNDEFTLTRGPAPTVRFTGNFDYLNLTASFVKLSLAGWHCMVWEEPATHWHRHVPGVELSHGRPSRDFHGVIYFSFFFFKSWHLRARQILWLQVCRIAAVTFEFGDNIKFTGLQLGVPGNTFWETSRSEHSGTDVATIEAATLKDSRGSMHEWKSGTLLGNFFLVVLGSRKKKFAVPVAQFFFCFLFCFFSFLRVCFLILGGEGGGGRERHPESVFFQKCSDFSSLRSSTKKWMTSFPPRSPRASGVGEPCEKMVGDVSQLTTIQAHQHGISLSPTVIFFLVVRYQILQNRPSSQNPPRISLSHVTCGQAQLQIESDKRLGAQV